MNAEPNWRPAELEVGGGRVHFEASRKGELHIPPKPAGYANAQLDDYRSLERSRFAWQPPLHLHLRARCSHSDPKGTLGFGFWNDPFSISMGQAGAQRRIPAPPAAVWFFYASPPSDFSFTGDHPGRGLRAMALQAPQIPPLLFTLGATAGWVLTQLPLLRPLLMNFALSQVQASESAIEAIDLRDWHVYDIRWGREQIEFTLDETPMLQSRLTISAPLGFVAWIDNQYAKATPRDGLQFGTIQTDTGQWLEIEHLSLKAA